MRDSASKGTKETSQFGLRSSEEEASIQARTKQMEQTAVFPSINSARKESVDTVADSPLWKGSRAIRSVKRKMPTALMPPTTLMPKLHGNSPTLDIKSIDLCAQEIPEVAAEELSPGLKKWKLLKNTLGAVQMIRTTDVRKLTNPVQHNFHQNRKTSPKT